MVKPGQIPIRFPERSLAFNEMAITPSNRSAIAAVRRVAHWPYHVFCLIGPKQSGLSTIATAWARECQGQYLTAPAFAELDGAKIEQLASASLAIDRADLINREDTLLSTISAVGRLGGHLLLTARQAPIHWSSTSPDLTSRLKSAPIADLGAPDEPLMRARLQRACVRAYLTLPSAVEDYLVTRLGLSFEGIEDVITRLNGAASGRAMSVHLAREVLQDDGKASEEDVG